MTPWLSRDHVGPEAASCASRRLLDQLPGSVSGGRGGAAGSADRPPFAESKRTHSSSLFELCHRICGHETPVSAKYTEHRLPSSPPALQCWLLSRPVPGCGRCLFSQQSRPQGPGPGHALHSRVGAPRGERASIRPGAFLRDSLHTCPSRGMRGALRVDKARGRVSGEPSTAAPQGHSLGARRNCGFLGADYGLI